MKNPKELRLENSDDLVIRFKQESMVEVFEHEDTELNEPVEERFHQNEEVEVTLFDDPSEHSLSVQFGDGSIAFLVPQSVEIVEVNGEPIEQYIKNLK